MTFNKMWCVGFLATATTVSVAQGGASMVVQDREGTEKYSTMVVTQVIGGIDTEKKLLIENIVAIVKPHLSQEEMSRLNTLLQDLASKVTVQHLFEIHKKLKSDVTKFGLLAMLGIKSQSCTAAPGNTSLQTNLQRILEKIRLIQYEKFVRENAAQLSNIIAQTLSTQLPANCLPALVDTVATISNLERPDEIQKALETFLNKHGLMLNAL